MQGAFPERHRSDKQMEKRKRVFWRYFKKNRLAVGGLVTVTIIFLIAIFAAVLSPYDPDKTDVSLKLKPPSSHNYLGTDQLGRDVLSRMLYGSRISLTVGFIAVGISILIGILIGATAGYYGGWVDSILMRLVDTMLCFPSFFVSSLRNLHSDGLCRHH